MLLPCRCLSSSVHPQRQARWRAETPARPGSLDVLNYHLTLAPGADRSTSRDPVSGAELHAGPIHRPVRGDEERVFPPACSQNDFVSFVEQSTVALPSDLSHHTGEVGDVIASLLRAVVEPPSAMPQRVTSLQRFLIATQITVDGTRQGPASAQLRRRFRGPSRRPFRRPCGFRVPTRTSPRLPASGVPKEPRCCRSRVNCTHLHAAAFPSCKSSVAGSLDRLAEVLAVLEAAPTGIEDGDYQQGENGGTNHAADHGGCHALHDVGAGPCAPHDR